MRPDTSCRVTVVGSRRQVHLSVPAHAPIGEYGHRLADLCGEHTDASMPPAWSVAAAGAAPLPLGVSLDAAGVLDGAVLYLHDLTVRPEDTPTVEDIDEVVATETGRRRRDGLPRGAVAGLLGLLWLTVVAVALPFRLPGGSTTAALLLTVTALALAGAAWALHQRGPAVPVAMPVLTALTALPCVAGAGALLAPFLGAPVYLTVALGGTVGAAIAVSVLPGAVVLVVAAECLVVALSAVVAALLGAGPADVAAAGVLTGLVLTGLAPWLAGTAAARAGRSAPAAGAPTLESVTRLLDRARHLHTAVLALPVLLLGVALPALGTHRSLFAVALACVAGVGLLLRAALTAASADAALLAVAGLTGPGSVLLTVTAGPGGWWSVPVLIVGGLVLVAAGAALLAVRPARRRRSAPADDDYPEDPRRSPVQVAALWCALLATPLGLGVFGVLDTVFHFGRDIVG